MEDEWLTEEQCTNRDEAGNILPEVITVKYGFGEKQPRIKYLPIPKGKLARLSGQQENRLTEEQLLKEHLLLPKLTDEKLKDMPYSKISGLIYAIVSGSTGLEQEQVKDMTLSAVVESAEEGLKKK